MNFYHFFIGLIVIALVFAALQVLMIWGITLVVTLVVGILLSNFLKLFNLRKYFSLLMLLVIFALSFTGLAEVDISYYIVTALYILSTLTFVLRKFKAEKDAIKLKMVPSDKDLAWIPIFANGFLLIFLYVPSIRASLSIQVENLNWYLYTDYVIYLILPVFTNKNSYQTIDFLQKNFMQSGVITKAELELECQKTLLSTDSDLEKTNKQQYFQRMVADFVSRNKIIKLDLEDDDFIYIKQTISDDLQTQIKAFMEKNSVSKKEDLFNSITLDKNISKPIIALILDNIIANDPNILIIDDWYFDVQSAEMISEIIKQQIANQNFDTDTFSQENHIDPSLLMGLISHFNIKLTENQSTFSQDQKTKNAERAVPSNSQNINADTPLIDVNKATESDLLALGLGVVQAKKLIAHRQEIGHFENTDAFIKYIKVPPNVLISITDKITCAPVQIKKQKHSGRRLEL